MTTISLKTIKRQPWHLVSIGLGIIILAALYPFAKALTAWSDNRNSTQDALLVQQPLAANANSSALPISAISWETPRSNWLYILDYINDPSSADVSGQVLLIDPQGQVHGRITTGFSPEIQLSPDGKRLYLTSKDFSADMLSIIDTATGRVIQTVRFDGLWTYSIISDHSTMAISADGRWLYVEMMRRMVDTIAVFDTTKGSFLPDELSILSCVSGVLLPNPANSQLQVLCMGTNDVRLLQTPQGSTNTLSLPAVADRRVRVSTGTTSRTGDTYAVFSDGRVVEIDGKTNKIRRQVVAQPLSAGYIPTRDVTLSPDGTKLYIGRGNLIARSTGEVDQILVTDTSSGRRLKTIVTGRPFWNLALSRDGNTLYAISALTRSIILIDTSSYQEVGIIENMGKSPTRAIAAP